MNVTFLEVGRTRLPHHRFRMKRLHCLPCTVANAFAVLIGDRKQDFQLVVVGFFVDPQNDAADLFAIHNNAVGFTVRCVNATLDGLAGYDLALEIDVVITLAELLQCAVFERPLVIQDKLLTVI